jgi:hypothetical protein
MSEMSWTEEKLEAYEKAHKLAGYVMVEWPESQRIMDHPLAKLEFDTDLYGSCAYWCPADVWDKYCNSYYYEEE